MMVQSLPGDWFVFFEKECNIVYIEGFLEEFLNGTDYIEYIYFENNKNCKSILNIKHYQVFFK